MTNGEAITALQTLQCVVHQIRKSDAAWEAIEMAKDALLAREKSKDDLVKHGRWREIGITMEYHHYTCSVCKHNVKSPGRFCPNCGAKMEGGDENG